MNPSNPAIKIATGPIQTHMDPAIMTGASPYLPGWLFLDLAPPMTNATGLDQKIVDLLIALKKGFGMTDARTLWPVGVPVLNTIPPDLTGVLSLKKSDESYPNTPAAAALARQQLVIQVPENPKDAVIRLARQTAGVVNCESVPQLWTPDGTVVSPPPQAKTTWIPWGYFKLPRGVPSPALETICVLDSGCDASHPNFGGQRILTDAITDPYGHGTMVCGIIAGNGVDPPNSQYPSGLHPGMLPTSKLLVCGVLKKVTLSSSVSFPLDIDPTGQYYLALGRLTGQVQDVLTPQFSGIKVVNLSIWSNGSSTKDKNYFTQMDGKIPVSAAGNGSGAVKYPAAYPQVISVGAAGIGPNGADGACNTCQGGSKGVDVWAPGQAVLSSLPRAGSVLGTKAGHPDQPGRYSGIATGTSFAAPFITAVVAAQLGPTPSKSDLTRQAALAKIDSALKHLPSNGGSWPKNCSW